MVPRLCPSVPQATQVGFLALNLMIRNGGIDKAENNMRLALPSALMICLGGMSIKGIVHTVQTGEDLDGL